MVDFKMYGGKFSDIVPSKDDVHSKDVEKRIVFAPGKFWDDYVARHFTVAPGTDTPFHSHDWPHYVLFLSGQCTAEIDGERYDLGRDCWAHVPSGTKHFFKNTGNEPFVFICIVPKEGDSAGQACFS